MLETNENVLRKAQTVSFVVLSSCELLHAVGMRNVKKTIIRKELFHNKLMLFALVLGFALQWLVVEVGVMEDVFKTAYLTVWEWCFVLGVSLLVVLVHEAGFSFKKRR